ncbi:MAG: hypothetical protein ACTS8P_00360 [Arsenophonus sp. NC-XBC3-MAG3]
MFKKFLSDVAINRNFLEIHFAISYYIALRDSNSLTRELYSFIEDDLVPNV